MEGNLSSAASATRAPLFACSSCSLRFDEAERTPCLLHCGHSFCAACLRAHARPLPMAPVQVNSDSACTWTISCPLDQKETPFQEGHAGTLGEKLSTSALIALPVVSDTPASSCSATVTDTVNAISTSACTTSSATSTSCTTSGGGCNSAHDATFRILLKTMAGELLPLSVAPDELVSEIKLRVHAQRPSYDSTVRFQLNCNSCATCSSKLGSFNHSFSFLVCTADALRDHAR